MTEENERRTKRIEVKPIRNSFFYVIEEEIEEVIVYADNNDEKRGE